MSGQNDTTSSIEVIDSAPVVETVSETTGNTDTPNSGDTTVETTITEVITPESSTTTEVDSDSKDLESALEAIIAGVSDIPFTFKQEEKLNDSESTEAGKTDEVGSQEKSNDENSDKDKPILDELTKIAEILTQENETFQNDKTKLEEELQAERQAKAEALELAQGVDEIWEGLIKEIPIFDQYAEAKSKGEDFTLPPQYNPEKFRVVEEHPIVGPLVKELLSGNSIDIPAFVKSLSDYRRSTMPNNAEAKRDSSITTPNNSRISTLGSMGGMKTVSFT